MKSTHNCSTAGAIAGTRSRVGARQRVHTPARYPVGAARQSADASDPMPYFEDLPAAQALAERAPVPGRPRVLHVDGDDNVAKVLVTLLAPEALVITAASLAEARRLLASEVFSLIVLDPALPDGDGRTLVPLLRGTPLLVYCAVQPEFRGLVPAYLPKPWTSARQLWICVAGLLGIPSNLSAAD